MAVGETGLDYFHDLAPRDVQRALFDRQLEMAAASGLPVVIHTRDADADTAAALASFPGTVILHCFSAPGLLETAIERRLLRLVRGQRDLPEGDRRSGRPPRPCRTTGSSPRRTVPTLRRNRFAASGTSRPTSLHTLGVLAHVRGEESAALERRIDSNASVAFGAPGTVSGHAPKKSLGQHFLADDNILGVIARLAELGPDDVALEIGPGLGALTAVLADRCAHVHAVEIDDSPRAPPP